MTKYHKDKWSQFAWNMLWIFSLRINLMNWLVFFTFLLAPLILNSPLAHNTPNVIIWEASCTIMTSKCQLHHTFSFLCAFIRSNLTNFLYIVWGNEKRQWLLVLFWRSLCFYSCILCHRTSVILGPKPSLIAMSPFTFNCYKTTEIICHSFWATEWNMTHRPQNCWNWKSTLAHTAFIWNLLPFPPSYPLHPQSYRRNGFHLDTPNGLS